MATVKKILILLLYRFHLPGKGGGLAVMNVITTYHINSAASQTRLMHLVQENVMMHPGKGLYGSHAEGRRKKTRLLKSH